LDVARIKVCSDILGWISEQLNIKVVGVVYVLCMVEEAEIEVSRVVEEGKVGEEVFFDGHGGSGDDEVVGTEVGVHFEEEDEVSSRKVNPFLLGVEVISSRLSLTNGMMGREEGQDLHFLGDQECDFAKEGFFLNQPLKEKHVEEGDGGTGMRQIDGGNVGTGAFNVPLMENTRAREIPQAQQS